MTQPELVPVSSDGERSAGSSSAIKSTSIPLVPGVAQLWGDERKSGSSFVISDLVTQGGPSSDVQSIRTTCVEMPVNDGTGPSQGYKAGSLVAALNHEHAAASESRVDTVVHHSPNVVQLGVGTTTVLSESTADLVPSERRMSECANVVDSEVASCSNIHPMG
ncbi:hypothetical protein V6N12_024269 [Hibiscus sabdariffa]|uniref:Uncharacterized protein n=1 Tax=Hibiscus sabdariffa TaxID=183260 RepID=A0ABR2G030_9ROSI